MQFCLYSIGCLRNRDHCKDRCIFGIESLVDQSGPKFTWNLKLSGKPFLNNPLGYPNKEGRHSFFLSFCCVYQSYTFYDQAVAWRAVAQVHQRDWPSNKVWTTTACPIDIVNLPRIISCLFPWLFSTAALVHISGAKAISNISSYLMSV